MMLLFLLLDEMLLIENASDSDTDCSTLPDTVTPALDTPCTASVPLDSSLPADHQSQLQSQSRPVLILSGVSATLQNSRHSSPTSQSISDVSSPDSTANYAIAAKNVSDSDSYRHCGSHVELFSDVCFDAAPANLVRSSNDCSLTGLQGSGNGIATDEAVSGLVSLQHKGDACSSADVSRNSSERSPEVPVSYMTASSDRPDEDAVDLSSCSSQLRTAEAEAKAKAVTGPSSDSSRCEPLSLNDYPALDSSSLDAGYQRAQVSAARFPAELCGSAAPLPPI